MTPESENSGKTHVTPRTEGRGLIQMKPLDSFQIDQVDFIKIDVEGYEDQVVRGAKCTLLKHKPVVLIEQKPSERYKWDQYSALYYLEHVLGYQIVERIVDDWILKSKL
jgi:hypothetical protein